MTNENRGHMLGWEHREMERGREQQAEGASRKYLENPMCLPRCTCNKGRAKSVPTTVTA